MLLLDPCRPDGLLIVSRPHGLPVSRPCWLVSSRRVFPRYVLDSVIIRLTRMVVEASRLCMKLTIVVAHGLMS